MQKIKWILMTAAIILGIGGAILTRPHASATTRRFYAASDCVSAAPDDETVQPAASH